MKILTRRGNCSSANSVTGTQASKIIGIITTLVELSLSKIARAAQKAIIIAAIETKRVESPIISFVGSRVRNFTSAYWDVRIPRNINTEVVAEKSEIESETKKTMKSLFSKKMGAPLSLLPPGMVKAAANIMVTMRADTNVLELAISFIHFSPSFTKSACCSENTSLGFFPSEFRVSLQIGGTMLSTSYNIIFFSFIFLLYCDWLNSSHGKKKKKERKKGHGKLSIGYVNEKKKTRIDFPPLTRKSTENGILENK